MSWTEIGEQKEKIHLVHKVKDELGFQCVGHEVRAGSAVAQQLNSEIQSSTWVSPSSSKTCSHSLLHLHHVVTPPVRQLSKLESSELLLDSFLPLVPISNQANFQTAKLK